METVYLVALSFFALVGIAYLARDGWRIRQCRMLCRAHFVLVCRAEELGEVRECERAFFSLSTFLTRPEAKYLVREVLITDTAPSQRETLHGAAQDLRIKFDTVSGEELIRRL